MSDETTTSSVTQAIDTKKDPKIGVFICHCGHNIAGTVDVKKVIKEVKDLPNVAVAQDYMFMCSKAGVQMVKDAVNEMGCDRTVVASCSKMQLGLSFAMSF